MPRPLRSLAVALGLLMLGGALSGCIIEDERLASSRLVLVARLPVSRRGHAGACVTASMFSPSGSNTKAP